MSVPLTDLNPRWLKSTTPGDPRERHGMGISFLCPVCRQQRLAIMFANPLDGWEPAPNRRVWQRSGDTFETLTLSPSVDASEGGKPACHPQQEDMFLTSHWHGFITQGVCA